MTQTAPTAEQLSFRSSKTGTHVLDTYLEAVEFGNLRLDQILAQIFSTSTGLPSAYSYKSNWQASTIYAVLDVVKQGSILYICNTAHTSGVSFDGTKFTAMADLSGTLPPGTVADTSLGADKFPRVNATATGYVGRTATELLSDIAAQPLDSDLTAIAALSTTTFGRSLLTMADAAAARTALGLGSLATKNTVATADIDNDSVTYAKLAPDARFHQLLRAAGY